MSLKRDIEYLFVELGKGVGDIATALGTTRGNVYHHINQAGGMDALNKKRVQRSISNESIEMREEQFLSKLIESFEKLLGEEDSIDLTPTSLINFTRAYQAITSAKNHNPARIKREARQEFLVAIRNLAEEQENESVFEFLSKNAEILVNAI